MSLISDFKNKNPNYKDVPDEVLSQALYESRYSDIPYNEFRKEFLGMPGLEPSQSQEGLTSFTSPPITEDRSNLERLISATKNTIKSRPELALDPLSAPSRLFAEEIILKPKRSEAIIDTLVRKATGLPVSDEEINAIQNPEQAELLDFISSEGRLKETTGELLGGERSIKEIIDTERLPGGAIASELFKEPIKEMAEITGFLLRPDQWALVGPALTTSLKLITAGVKLTSPTIRAGISRLTNIVRKSGVKPTDAPVEIADKIITTAVKEPKIIESEISGVTQKESIKAQEKIPQEKTPQIQSGSAGSVGKYPEFSSEQLTGTPPHPPIPTELRPDQFDQVINKHDIVKELFSKFDTPHRKGGFRSKAIGIFKIKPEVVRTKYLDDVETVSHELGHYLEKKVFGTTKLKGHGLSGTKFKDFADELVPIATKANKASSDLSEGFAEYMSKYVTDFDSAKKVAPKFTKWFDNYMDANHSDIKDILLAAREQYHIYKNMPSTAKVMAQISFEADKKTPFPTFTDIYKNVKDRLYPLAKITKAINPEISIADNPYVLARLYSDWVGTADMFLRYGQVKPGFKIGDKIVGKSYEAIISPVAKDRRAFSTYLVAKRAVDLSKRGIATGINPADAVQAVKELESPLFVKTALELKQYRNNVFEHLIESGLFTRNEFEIMKILNENYVPFHRLVELDTTGTGKGFTSLFKPTKRIKGGTELIVDPLETDIKNTYAYIQMAKRNNVMKKIVGLAEGEGGGKLGDRVARKMKPVKFRFEDVKTELFKSIKSEIPEGEHVLVEELRGILDSLSETMQEKVFTLFRPSMTTPKGSFAQVFKKGKPVLYEFNPEIFRTISAMDEDAVGMLVKILSVPAKLLRVGATATPEFMLKNSLRDPFASFVYSKSGFIPGLDSARGLYHTLLGDKLYQAMRIGGGGHSMMVSVDRKVLQKKLKEVLNETTKSGLVKNIITHPIDSLRVLSELSETMNRLGEFGKTVKHYDSVMSKVKTAIEKAPNATTRGNEFLSFNVLAKKRKVQNTKKGLVEFHNLLEREKLVAASFNARENPQDFLRIGYQMKAVNMLTAFFNARVEGVDRMARAFIERPFVSTAKATAAITIPSILLYEANKDRPEYKRLPTWEKMLFWHVITDEHIYRIPKPFELGVIFGTIPEIMLDYHNSKNKEVLNERLVELIKPEIGGLAPTFAVAPSETFFNKNLFTGNPIVSKNLEGMEPQFQSVPWNSEVSKQIGRILNMSPSKIDHLIYGWTGGIGRLVVEGIDKAILQFVDEPVRPSPTFSDIPMLRSFVSRYPNANTNTVERFYNRYSTAKIKYDTFNKLVTSGRLEEADKYFKSNINDIAQYQKDKPFFDYAVDSIADMRKVITLIYNSRHPEMTASEKRKRIDRLFFEIIKTAEAVDSYMRTGKDSNTVKLLKDRQLREAPE